jgi:hypothetical protein
VRIRRPAVTLLAAAVTLLVYTGLAWLASGIDIPPEAPTALAPWIRPLRVIASVGFVIAAFLHVPHLAGDFLAAILLGAVLGTVFALVRQVLR